eukprot:TRINITY_DN93660_c0_g1_i1.p1 TRINITY_DN93660_c0_g1~~TRINITY_DN93660_c0_g1_i1.p1  ORF type:complete len:307 (+),score=136.47 TRINITY_DN93660_c0_g1_i1:67-921(+)
MSDIVVDTRNPYEDLESGLYDDDSMLLNAPEEDDIDEQEQLLKRLPHGNLSSSGASSSSSSVHAGARRSPLYEVERAFVRKVFSIVAVQLMLTSAICAVFMYTASIRHFAVSHPSLLQWVTLVPLFASLFAMVHYKSSYPSNYAWMFVFTALMSVSVGTVCAQYYAVGEGILILKALIITSSVFVALVIFALQTRIDFSFMRAGLFVSTLILIFLGIGLALFGVRMPMVVSAFGALVFSLWVLYDTSMLMHKHGTDDYIVAAIDLYLDFVNLFLYILQLLSDSQ